MARMIDLIRKSGVSATVMQAAARGALLIPADEMIEILVHLANHNKIFGAQARMRLAEWDLKSAVAVASNPKSPEEVLRYMAAEENLRPGLLPALLENPAVPEESLAKLARTGSRDVVKVIGESARLAQSAKIRQSLGDNPNCSEAVAIAMSDKPAPANAPIAPEAPAAAPAADGDEGSTSAQVEQASVGDPEADEQVAAFIAEHASEIAAEGNKPFQPVGGMDTLEAVPAPEPSVPEAAVVARAGQSGAATAAQPHKAYHARQQEGAKRDSTLQKIAKLDIKGRIQLAMKGSKEERSILIRDGTKLVALAVLDSPKITDGEVEGFASQKNVLEAVLRGIPMKRRFAKHYPVIRNLVFNPRTPIDLSLGLMKNLLVNDLKNLSGNKEVSDTIRKLALKMFKQKIEPGKHGG
ncbi:MAG TPA: hypothetical protein VMT53_05535 [Terriglobales bacterium]|nr:hypothetical protein [Terriglobales bacterium]